MSSSSLIARARALLLALAVAGGLAGCGEPPKPFAHDGDPKNPLLQVANPEGVAIVELIGFSGAGERKFLDTLVEQFHRAEVPALVGEGNAQSYRLSGAVAQRKTPSGTEIAIQWQMVNANNQILGTRLIREVVEPKAWTDGDPALVTALARKSGAELLPLLPDRDRALKQAKIPDAPQEPGRNNIVPPLGTRAAARPAGRPQVAQVGPSAPAQSATGQPTAKPRDLPPVALRPIEGAPGDGADSLQKALLHFLGIANVQVLSEHDTPFAVIAGVVTMSSVSPRVQNVKIEWVLRGLSGCQMGTVSQANQIPAGQLDRAWGDAAFAVAEGAVQGLTDLLVQLEKMPEGQRCKR